MSSLSIPKAMHGLSPIEALSLAAANDFTLLEVGLADTQANRDMLEIAKTDVLKIIKMGGIVDISN